MDLDILKAALESANILPVRIEGNACPSEDHGLRVMGSLDDYLAVLKALRAPVVLLYTTTLQEDDFLYAPEEEGPIEDEVRMIELCVDNPELSKFKPHIGRIGSFRLSVRMQTERLDYYIQESWYLEFERRWSETVDKIDSDRTQKCAAENAERNARIDEQLARVDSLIDDQRFVRLPTQKARLAYALETIPGLDEVDKVTLKERIQDVSAKIAARIG